MKISRRKFFRNAGIAAFASAVLLPPPKIFGQTLQSERFFPIPPESTNDPFNYLRRDHFVAVVNSVFRFQSAEGRSFNLQLIAADDLSLGANAKQGMTGESFSLLFEGSKKSKIPQGEYEVAHDSLGAFRLFIVPVGLRGNRYEAIINRINIPA
jgi:hypothetical protein